MPNESQLHPDIVAAERLGNEIAELSAHIEIAMARLLDKIREFDALGGWGPAGAKSCAEWLSWRVGLDLRAAYERVRVARALPTLPLISAAFARAEISYSKVRALTRVATPDTEDRLLKFAKNGTAAHVEKLTRAWRRVDRNAENREAEQQHRSRSLCVYQDEDGMFVIRGRLTPEVGAVVRQAHGSDRPTVRGGPGTGAGRAHTDDRSDAGRCAGHHGRSRPASRPRPRFVGRPLSGRRSRRC